MQVNVIDTTGWLPCQTRGIEIRDILVGGIREIQDLHTEIQRISPVAQQQAQHG